MKHKSKTVSVERETLRRRIAVVEQTRRIAVAEQTRRGTDAKRRRDGAEEERSRRGANEERRRQGAEEERDVKEERSRHEQTTRGGVKEQMKRSLAIALSLFISTICSRSEKPEASIDYSTLIPSLNEALLEACGAFSADLLLVRYLQRLESIFTGVPIPCDVLFTDPLSSELNVLSHIRDPFLSSLHQWTKKKLSMNSFSRVVGWSFIHFLDPQCPRSIHFHNISDVTIFAALTLSLRSDPLSLVVRLPLMRNRHLYYQKRAWILSPLQFGW
ncbi:PREDICTED: uncharacterized protein LOC106337998 [Brassica oleracea var. oleracea]|uniref:uncharacterized protein LOC106337998 n=1 Tax=Brassica oleracea var. oleracea TaxID=109376 RepID=UPI0006A6BB97|nr:PREDICTED: uncharacterized protein LOC106337998 [Brassica oleracea var. oleracea]